jgi:hypothetical protein
MTQVIKIETNEEERKETQAKLRAELAKLAMPSDHEMFISLLSHGRTSGHDQR